MTQICLGEACRAAKCAACCWNHPVASQPDRVVGSSFLRSDTASALEELLPPAIAAPRRPRNPPSVLRPEVVFAPPLQAEALICRGTMPCGGKNAPRTGRKLRKRESVSLPPIRLFRPIRPRTRPPFDRGLPRGKDPDHLCSHWPLSITS